MGTGCGNSEPRLQRQSCFCLSQCLFPLAQHPILFQYQKKIGVTLEEEFQRETFGSSYSEITDGVREKWRKAAREGARGREED